MKIRLCREISLPDPIKVARYARDPAYGPRLLFFSGGSALRPLSRELINYTWNSIHIITAVDYSGTSC